MKCHQFHESIIDLATADPGPGELQDHLRACTSCSAELKSLRETMSLLDEWQARAQGGDRGPDEAGRTDTGPPAAGP